MTSVHFLTQGCSANAADSEIMAGLLRERGFSVVDTEDDAEVVVFNTCTVKGKTESFFRKKMKEFDSSGKKVIVAGCIPQSRGSGLESYSKIGTQQLGHIVHVVEETLRGNVVSELSRKNENRLNLPKLRKNPFVEIVPISQGCKSTCTFCKTKHARGDLVSQTPTEIVRHISSAASEGVQEVWLTSQDNGVYGFDCDATMASLLNDVCSIDRNFKVRVGMANPGYLNTFLSDFVSAMQHSKVFKFVHIPVQAGSDSVLKEMNRDHSVEDYVEIVTALRKAIPNITIATDIIVAFPTETDEDFEKTLELVRTTRPDVINISKYWPRPGTKAAGMKQVPGAVAKERAKKLMDLFKEITHENKQKWIGWEGKILITETGKEGQMIGRNDSYVQVVVEGEKDLLGKTLHVKVTDATTWDLRADTVSDKV